VEKKGGREHKHKPVRGPLGKGLPRGKKKNVKVQKMVVGEKGGGKKILKQLEQSAVKKKFVQDYNKNQVPLAGMPVVVHFERKKMPIAVINERSKKRRTF